VVRARSLHRETRRDRALVEREHAVIRAQGERLEVARAAGVEARSVAAAQKSAASTPFECET